VGLLAELLRAADRGYREQALVHPCARNGVPWMGDSAGRSGVVHRAWEGGTTSPRGPCGRLLWSSRLRRRIGREYCCTGAARAVGCATRTIGLLGGALQPSGHTVLRRIIRRSAGVSPAPGVAQALDSKRHNGTPRRGGRACHPKPAPLSGCVAVTAPRVDAGRFVHAAAGASGLTHRLLRLARGVLQGRHHCDVTGVGVSRARALGSITLRRRRMTCRCT